MKKSITLGRRSSFFYDIENNIMMIKFGKLKKPIVVKKDVIDAVKERIKNSPSTYKYLASNYNKKKWDDCPNNRICPYVAQLIISKKYV